MTELGNAGLAAVIRRTGVSQDFAAGPPWLLARWPVNARPSAGILSGGRKLRLCLAPQLRSEQGHGLQAASRCAVFRPVGFRYIRVSATWKRRKRRAPSARVVTTLNRAALNGGRIPPLLRPGSCGLNSASALSVRARFGTRGHLGFMGQGGPWRHGATRKSAHISLAQSALCYYRCNRL